MYFNFRQRLFRRNNLLYSHKFYFSWTCEGRTVHREPALMYKDRLV